MTDDHTPRTGTPVTVETADSSEIPASAPRAWFSAPALPKVTPPGASAALVLGILAIVFWAVPFLGLTCGILAIVIGSRSRSAVRADPARYLPSGAATAGVVCGIIGTILSTLTTAIFAFVIFLMSLVMSLMGMAGGGHVPPPIGHSHLM